MKKTELEDDLRPEYRREDFGTMERGRYASRIQAESNVVVIEPEISKVFPNDKAVNDALRSLIEVARATTRSHRPRRHAGKMPAVPG